MQFGLVCLNEFTIRKQPVSLDREKVANNRVVVKMSYSATCVYSADEDRTRVRGGQS
jgi:hypothetical protein